MKRCLFYAVRIPPKFLTLNRGHLNVLVAAKFGSDVPWRRPVFVGAQFHCAMGDGVQTLLSPSETGLLHDGDASLNFLGNQHF
jgi:hypothetical protein